MNGPGPVEEQERNESLDVLRGFALFGVFMVNVSYMAMSTSAADKPEGGFGDQSAWAFVKILFESKFVALFSLLFGAGLVMQALRAEAKGRRLGWTVLRRLAVLAVIGLLHGTLLFVGDILLPYAAMGLVLYAAHRLPARILGGIGLALALLAAGLSSVGFELLPAPEEQPSRIDDIDSTLGMLDVYFNGSDEDRDYIETVAFRQGPLESLLVVRSAGYFGWLLLSTLIGFNTRVLALFFLGAAAMKLGLFRAERRDLHRKLLARGLVVGLTVELLLVALRTATDHEGSWILALVLPIRTLTSIVLAGAYAGGVLLLVWSRALAPLRHGLAGVGRLSLSNYLGQSIAANLIFCYFGLALFGELSRWELVGIVCVVFLFQMIASTLWLRAFRIGPFEWLWRSLSYGRPQPLLRR
ncbi:MAG: DUF418 domain-containing protein [Planctomycetota bacterium]|nr:DUF418 domain-containing protein [Planctomycetota bacterium]